MWRDDFEDGGTQIKVVRMIKAGELINDPGLESEDKAEPSDDEPRS